MGKATRLRASTLAVLLLPSSSNAFLPSRMTLARCLPQHHSWRSALPRIRSPKLRTVALGQGMKVKSGDSGGLFSHGLIREVSGQSDLVEASSPMPHQSGERCVVPGKRSSYDSNVAQHVEGSQQQSVAHEPAVVNRFDGSGWEREASGSDSPPNSSVAGTSQESLASKSTNSVLNGKEDQGATDEGEALDPTNDSLLIDGRNGHTLGSIRPKTSSSGSEARQQGSLFAGDAERAAERAADGVTAVASAVTAAMEEQRQIDGDHEERDGCEEETGHVSKRTLSGRWSRRIAFVFRTVQLWTFLFQVLFKLLRQKLVTQDDASMSKRRRELGRYLCRAFLKLGPTFIKIGQLLSTRVDLLSNEYIEELRQLQDNVPGFGEEKAVEIVEDQLGAPVTELFDSFNSTPLAAASLGQVHEAWLDGRRYAVKVQRPGVKDLFEVDLKSIGVLAAVLDRFDPKLDGATRLSGTGKSARRISFSVGGTRGRGRGRGPQKGAELGAVDNTKRDWGSIYRESSRVLYEEIDYTREGQNAERFAENFKNMEWVKVPKINWKRSTSKVLCMEFLDGIKITDVERIEALGIDRNLLARRTAECYLAQLCRHGFFHCDPHPGNLACDAAVAGGRIIFYDFGMMDELTMPLKRGLVNLIFGIYGNDVKEVVDSLEDMDVIRKGADRMTVERITRFYLGEFQNTLTKGGKYINQLDAQEEKALIRRERAQIGQDLFSGQAAVPLQFPASFTFVFRAFTTLDGIGKTLDPSYDLTKIAAPYLKELLDLKDGSAYVSVLKNWQKRLGWRGQDVASVVQSPRRLKHVNDVVTQLERGDLRLRVRVLESEASLARIEAVQGSLTAAVMSTLLLNAGVALASCAASGPAILGSRASFALAALFGLQVPVGYFQVWRMKRQERGTKGFR